MALRERLLQQSREDKMVEDDRKVKLIAETNRSTDLALQAQSAAMSRKREDAAAMAQEAAYLGEEVPRFDLESGAVRDAAARGAGAGAMSSEKQVRAEVARRLLENIKQEGATGRTVYSQTQANERAGATRTQREEHFGKEFPLKQQEAVRQDALLQPRIRELNSRAGMEDRSPVGYTAPTHDPVIASLKRFEDVEKQYPTAFSKSQTFGNEAERAVNQTLRERLRYFKEEATRAGQMAAGKEIAPGRRAMAAELAVQAVYDRMMRDPDFLGALQQMTQVQPFAPRPAGAAVPVDSNADPLAY